MSRIVLQIDKTALEDKELLGNEYECCTKPDIGSIDINYSDMDYENIGSDKSERQ